MTPIPHRSNDHIQNRSSGRSNSVSSRTLKTPSWPTTTDHGLRRRRLAVAGDLGPIERARARPRSASRASTPASAGRSRAATSGIASPPGAHASSGRRRHVARTSPQRRSISVAVEALPLALADLEEARLGPRSGSAARTRQLVGHRPARSRRPSAAVRPSGEWTISSGGPAGPAGPGTRAGRARRAATPLGLAPPDRRERRLGLALEPALDDELRLAVADEDERRVEPVRDERRRRRRGRRGRLSARCRAGSSTGRGPLRGPGSRRRPPAARRRRGPGP